MEFYNDPLKVDEYEKMCVDYNGSELYEVLDRNLKDESSLLELGCGPGNDIYYLRNKYKVIGSDFSEEFLRRCKKRFSDISFLKLDATSLDTKESFDCIFSNKVLHHLTSDELEKSLKRQQDVISPNGLFAHTFWLGDKEFEMEGMLFLFHDQEKLVGLVSKYFTIVETHTYKEFEEEDSIFILAKNNKM